MGTVLAITSAGGVVIAGDSRATSDGTVTSEHAQRVFDFDAVGTGAVGTPGDVDEYGRRLESELRRRRLESDVAPDLQWVSRAAAEITADLGVDAVVGATDDSGDPGITRVGSDGSVLSDATVALGSGAALATGRLEGVDRDRDLESTVELAREVLDSVADRDPETGGETSVWTLSG